MICASACHISSETALWRAGLLKMIRPTAPSFSPIILVVARGWSSIGAALLLVRAPSLADRAETRIRAIGYIAMRTGAFGSCATLRREVCLHIGGTQLPPAKRITRHADDHCQ